MGNWKSKLRATDLSDDARLELQCRKCGQVRYLTKEAILERNAGHLYLDMIETRTQCRVKGCNSKMRLSMVHKNQTSGFVGGLA